MQNSSFGSVEKFVKTGFFVPFDVTNLFGGFSSEYFCVWAKTPFRLRIDNFQDRENVGNAAVVRGPRGLTAQTNTDLTILHTNFQINKFLTKASSPSSPHLLFPLFETEKVNLIMS